MKNPPKALPRPSVKRALAGVSCIVLCLSATRERAWRTRLHVRSQAGAVLQKEKERRNVGRASCATPSMPGTRVRGVVGKVVLDVPWDVHSTAAQGVPRSENSEERPPQKARAENR